MLVQIAIAILCCALPGLLLRRAGPWPARVAALVALLVIGVAVLDLPRQVLSMLPSRVEVVPTTALDEAAAAALAARFPADRVQVLGGAGPLAQRLASARLRHAEEPALALVWTGRFATSPAPRPVSDRPVAVLGDRPPVALDPEAIEVRLLRVPAVGRPGGLEVRVGGAPAAGWQGRLRIVDPADRPVVDAPLAGAAVTPVAWRPEQPGAHTVYLTLQVDGVDYQAAAKVEVAGANRVLVVGARGAEFAKVLAVQGLDAQWQKALPATLAARGTGTLVLLDRVGAADQQRLVRFVEDGGGLFLVGDATGGAVPVQDDPLAQLAPVVRLPVPADAPGAGPGTGQDPNAPPGERPSVPPPKPPVDPPPDDPTAARGDTRKARLTAEEREAQRRVIAMVLMVDRSGSMQSRRAADNQSCMDAAKASALQSAQALDGDQDLLGVVSFGNKDSGRVVLPMTPAREGERIRQALAGLRAGKENTHLRDGLNKARALLDGVRASIKCVVVVTDGFFHDLTDAPTASAVRALERSKVSMQIVQLLSDQPDPTPTSALDLQNLARLGNGRVVAQKSADKVPKLVITEVQRLRTRVGRTAPGDGPGDGPGTGPQRQPDPPRPDPPKPQPPKPQPPPDPKPPEPAAVALAVHVIEDSRLLEPAPAGDFPPVGGVLPAGARPGTRVLLAAGPDGIPLLAFANRGLGKVGAWTADLFGPWSQAWVAEPGFPGRLAQWVQAVAAAAGAPIAERVLHRPEVLQPLPLPAEVRYLAALGGSPLRPVDTFVPPVPAIRTEVRGRAVGHAWYGLWILLILAGIEFLSVRRRRRRA